MRQLVYLRRDGEGVARWAVVAVMLAVIALVAASLSFPAEAAAQTTSTPASTMTSLSTPVTSASTTTPATPASTASRDDGTARTSEPRLSPTQPTAVEQKVGDGTSTVRSSPQPSTRTVQPYALNPDIVVTISDLDRSPTPVGPDESLKIRDEVRVTGTWDASALDPKAGDQFVIDFPEEIEVEAEGFPLLGEGNSVWGNCVIDAAANRVTCTLTDAVEGLSEVGGTFEMFSKAVKRTTIETVNFGVNGKVQAVRLPGQGGISDGVTIGDASKTGKLNADKQSVTWTVSIPGSDLIALDSDGTGIVTLDDTLSDNMTLYEEKAPTLQAGRGTNMTEIPGGASIVPGTEPGRYDIVITNGGAFDPDLVYQVIYQTRTVTGDTIDPVGTKYTNSVAIGGNTVGDSVGQDWELQAPGKGGNWAGGFRYDRINWTITVPGTLAQNGVFTIADVLGVSDSAWAHQVCDDGLGLSVRMVNHLPDLGGSSPGPTVVTTKFATEPPTAGATSFNFGLTWNDQDNAFDPEKYYRISYSTCVTGSTVPPKDVKFTNTATVNGNPVDATVEGRDFPKDRAKKGTFNTVAKTVNGVEQPANTTVDWTLTVPGRDLEDIEGGGPAVITDVFSETLAVCDAGGDLKQNLNLTVTPRVYLGNSQIELAPITADTSVTSSDNTLTFTLPRPDDGYERRTSYDIAYTLCTASGGVDARGTEYSNNASWWGGDAKTEVKRSSGAGGTGQGVSRGSFSLKKSVAPFSEEFSIENTTFTVKVEEFAPDVDPATGKADETYTVEIKADGTPVSGLNTRGPGWQIRLTEINLPHGNGVYFQPGVFRPAAGVTLNDDATQALVTIKKGENVDVALVNKAVFSSATITKTVVDNTGGELTGTEEFVVEARINSSEEGSGSELRQFTLRDGQSYGLGKLPIGTEVTFSEVLPANTDRVTWATPVITPERLVIGNNPAANAVSVTNTASITEGSFSVSKKLKGPEADNPAVPGTFEIIASWDVGDGPQEKPLTLPKNGAAVAFGENLPGGTEVTLTEVLPADGNGLAWGAPTFSGAVQTAGGNSAVVVIGQDPGQVKVSNYVGTNTGTLQVIKRVSGEAAEAVGDDATFTVEARWQDRGGFRTKKLELTADVPTTLDVDLPYGTQVTLREVGTSEVDNVDWAGLTWGTNPENADWIDVNGEVATVIVSDDPTEGRLVTLDNEARWSNGSVAFEKFVFDGEDPVRATDADLPSGAAFQVRIDGIDPALPAGTDFPAVGETITLNSGNDWQWQSGDVLPRGTVITFSEVDPAPLDGVDWARPFYYVAADAGEPGDRDTVEIAAGDTAEVQIRNRPVPTGDVVIDKVVSGVKGDQVVKHSSTTFQVTATWTDPDDESRSCILDVRPDGTMTPTVECDAVVIGDRVQFPLDTEISFVETGARTDVTNVKWGEVIWSVQDGEASAEAIDGEPAGAVVTLTGDGPVTLGLENKTSSNGLIILPFPLPIPGFGCNCGDTGSLGSGPGSGSLGSGSGSGSGSDSGSGSGSGSLGSLGLGSLGLGSLGLGSLGSGSNASGSLPGSTGTGSVPGSIGTGSNSGSAGSDDQGSNDSGSNGGSAMGSLDSASLGIGAGSAAAGSDAGSAGSTALGSAGSTAAGSLGLPGSVAAGSLGTIILGSLGSSDGSADGSTGDGSLNGGSDGSGDGSLGSGPDQDAPGSGSPSGPDGATGPGGGDAPDQPSSPESAPNGGATPVEPMKPSAVAGNSGQGHDGAPGRPAPAKPQSPQSLAVTGTDVAWLGGAALALLAGGAWLVLRSRRDAGIEE